MSLTTTFDPVLETFMSNGKSSQVPNDDLLPHNLVSTPNQLPTQISKKASKSSKRSKKRRTRKSAKKLSKPTAAGDSERRPSPGGGGRPYPSATFESVLPLAKAIFDNAGASREMRRETVFEKLGRAASSGPSRQLVITSGRYGLTIGG